MHRRTPTQLLKLVGASLCFVAGPALAHSNLTLKLTESVTLPSVGKITFIHAQDERCPVDVQCLVPGSAYALLWLELGAKKSLVAVSWPQQQSVLEVSNKFFGSKFCFVSLEPKPSQVTPTQAHTRVLTFIVRQSSSPESSCASGA
jgi:hypothetical protein